MSKRSTAAPVEPPLPASVRVGPYTYEVQLVPGMESWGYIDFGLQRISLSADITYQRRAASLLHEIMHAITDAAGVEHRMGKMDEEDVVLTLSATLTAVLQQNPEAVAYIVGAA